MQKTAWNKTEKEFKKKGKAKKQVEIAGNTQEIDLRTDWL